jgi:hypothetical protein
VLLALLALPGSGALACGQEEPAKPPPPVVLSIEAPRDAAVVQGDAVEITGTVSPKRADVVILGKPVDVGTGRFTASVDLDPGANIIDVAASADGRRPAVTAIRVVREMPVSVPDLAGERPDVARQRLEALGLQVLVQEGGSFFDELFGGDFRVCSSDPDAGETVRPGTTVTLDVQRGC